VGYVRPYNVGSNNNHPAIINEETFNIVQRLRGTKRRVYKLDEDTYRLTGILYCADCGAKMYHKRGNTGRDNQPHHEYVCANYRHYTNSCTCHYIRVSVVENLILTAIKKVSGYVRENEAEFVKRVHDEAELQQEAAVMENRKKLTKAQRRRDEINTLIKKLYESYAADKIPEKHFTELLKGYDTEQAGLDTEIEKLQAEIDRYNTDSVRADKFIELVKRHTEFTEFSPFLLNEFVERIIVHEADKSSGKREQKLDIYLNYIGKFELPEIEAQEQEEEAPARTSTKKLRREMTEEEKQRAREKDHYYYTRKVAAKRAAEQAERVAILQGTVYEIRPDQTGESEVKKTA